jgi:hypothetical protein
MMDDSLRAAYLAARYLVAVDGDRITLEIGRPAPDLDKILIARSVESAAFVTAWNPHSTWHARDDNLVLGSRLATAVEQLGLAALPVTTTADDPRWVEHGLLILGIFEPRARRLGEQFAQNAIVMVDRGAAPRLIDLVSKDATW